MSVDLTTPADQIEEYIVSSGAAGKKKHRPLGPNTNAPACDTHLHDDSDREWQRKPRSQTIFQDHCQKPGCFGDGGV